MRVCLSSSSRNQTQREAEEMRGGKQSLEVARGCRQRVCVHGTRVHVRACACVSVCLCVVCARVSVLRAYLLLDSVLTTAAPTRVRVRPPPRPLQHLGALEETLQQGLQPGRPRGGGAGPAGGHTREQHLWPGHPRPRLAPSLSGAPLSTPTPTPKAKVCVGWPAPGLRRKQVPTSPLSSGLCCGLCLSSCGPSRAPPALLALPGSHGQHGAGEVCDPVTSPPVSGSGLPAGKGVLGEAPGAGEAEAGEG